MDEIIANYKKVLLSWSDFNGRTRRREYWFYFLALIVIYIVAGIIDGVLLRGGKGLFLPLAILIHLVPNLAVSFRRMHDIGKSALWLLIGLIPVVGGLVILYFSAKDSDADNIYGPNPKGLITSA